MAQENETYKAW